MNIKILAQNIASNPNNFTAEQIERYFEDYVELRLSTIRNELLITNEQDAFDRGYTKGWVEGFNSGKLNYDEIR
jgi:hypothetical protein